MQQFIPITDDYLEHDPALYARLVPFNLDYSCRRLALESSLDPALDPVAPVTAKYQLASTQQGESHE